MLSCETIGKAVWGYKNNTCCWSQLLTSSTKASLLLLTSILLKNGLTRWSCAFTGTNINWDLVQRLTKFSVSCLVVQKNLEENEASSYKEARKKLKPAENLECDCIDESSKFVTLGKFHYIRYLLLQVKSIIFNKSQDSATLIQVLADTHLLCKLPMPWNLQIHFGKKVFDDVDCTLIFVTIRIIKA